MSERTGHNWSGSIGGNCPVQGEGTIDGHPWYFRARGEYWTIDIIQDPNKDPLDVGDVDCPGWHDEGRYGDWPSAGWMTDDEAWRFIEVAMAGFNASALQYVTCDTPFVRQIRSSRRDKELDKYHRGFYRGTKAKQKALRRIMRKTRAMCRHIAIPDVAQLPVQP